MWWLAGAVAILLGIIKLLRDRHASFTGDTRRKGSLEIGRVGGTELDHRLGIQVEGSLEVGEVGDFLVRVNRTGSLSGGDTRRIARCHV